MTDINKQIEIAESIVIRLKKENYEKNQSFNSYICQDFKCKDCPAGRIYHNDISCIDRRDTLEWFENWLKENKPQPKMTKEELKIGQQVTFYSRVTNSDKTGKIEDFDLYTKHPVVNVGKFYINYNSGGSISKLCPSFDDIKFVNGMQFVHESNNSQTKPDFEPHTEWTRLDKILDNIESLEKQKKVIEERIVESENQLLCKLNGELLCEYVASDSSFNITTEGSRLENIHLVRDFIDSLLKVEEV